MSSVIDVVQRQFEAYNAHDLERFVACYSATVRAFRPPATEPAISGMEAFRAFYATQRFNRPTLHAQLINRIAFGNKVIDHERISGVADQPYDIAVVYEVIDSVIATTWTYPAT